MENRQKVLNMIGLATKGGIEKSPLYCAWAEKRLEDAKWDKTIQGYNDGVFWERNTAPRANKIKKSENK